MIQYIDKSALVAEIKRRMDENRGKQSLPQYFSMIEEDLNILSFLDTLEVKEVELEQEIENLIEKEKAFVTDNREVKYYNGDSFNHIYELEFIAKHFFKLGMQVSNKAQKEE